MKRLLQNALHRAGLDLQRAASADVLRNTCAVAVDLVAALTSTPAPPGEATAEAVVFSMDRAMQLDALLGSYVALVTHPAPLHVLYRASSDKHRKAYEEVLPQYADVVRSVTVQRERSTFREQLLGIVGRVQASKIFCLVDDDVFIEPVDLLSLSAIDTRYAIPALRLGANLSVTYVVQQEQPLPRLDAWRNGARAAQAMAAGDAANDDLLCWSWSEGLYEWAYPLSLDGHLFGTAEFMALLRHTPFDSPNTLEGNLQTHAGFFTPRLGVCYRKARLVNVPCNKVQTDNANIHGDIHQDDLLRLWQSGRRIDLAPLYGYPNRGAHEEIPLAFRHRTADP